MAKKIAIILAGGLNADGTLPNYCVSRANEFIKLRESFSNVICSSLFTLNVCPKLDSNGFPISESVEIARYIYKNCGIIPLIENSSFDTIGSAFFTRQMIDVLFPGETIDITIFTSDFHLERAKIIFKRVYSLSPNSNRFSVEAIGDKFKGSYNRIQKEICSTKDFLLSDFNSVKSLDMFAAKIFTNHQNYNIKFSSNFSNNSNMCY